MGKLIPFKKNTLPKDNLITAAPMEFRRARWASLNFIQMRRFLSERYEADVFRGQESLTTPPHFVLDKGMEVTITGLFTYRHQPELMKEVYLLAGMVDLLINKVSPILRTDLIRGVYNKVFELKNRLNIFWSGPIQQVLLPIEPALFNEEGYRVSLITAKNLKELYELVRQANEEMFLILCKEYVFYCPNPKGEV